MVVSWDVCVNGIINDLKIVYLFRVLLRAVSRLVYLCPRRR